MVRNINELSDAEFYAAFPAGFADPAEMKLISIETDNSSRTWVVISALFGYVLVPHCAYLRVNESSIQLSLHLRWSGKPLESCKDGLQVLSTDEFAIETGIEIKYLLDADIFYHICAVRLPFYPETVTFYKEA